MTTRSWQIYGVGFIAVVIAALVALWVSPADAQTRQVARSKERAVRTPPAKPREIVPPRPSAEEPAPPPPVPARPVSETKPSPRAPRVPDVAPPTEPAPREPVAPREPAPRTTPRPEPARPTLPPVVRPEIPVVPPQRPIRDENPDRDRDRPTPPPTHRPPVKVHPVEPVPPPPMLEPIFDCGPIEVLPDVLYCEEALVCPLDRWDDVLAWRLARAAGIYYWQLVYERVDGWSWYAIMNRFDIDRRTFYDALGVNWSPIGVFRDDEVRMAIVDQVGNLILPEFSCELPITLPPTTLASMRQFPMLPDAVDEKIAQRISDDTLWCVDTLLALHGHLRNWGAVARTLYLSPYMFETVFDVELEVRAGVVEYPCESDLRFAVLDANGGDGQVSTLGKVAKGLTLVALGVAGVVSGLF